MCRSESVTVAALLAAAVGMVACSHGNRVEAGAAAEPVSVGVTRAIRMPLERDLTLSSELVPFQEIEVYAKESGYVRQLNVDYGTRVTKGQLMAVLEIPGVTSPVKTGRSGHQEPAATSGAAAQESNRVEAQHKVLALTV